MDTWLPTLITDTPQAGYELAVKLSRMSVKLTQQDAAVRDRLRAEYAVDSDALIAVSQVVATHFATVAAANGYWT
ncbi:peroxidase [Paracoccus sp. S-4012]|uniref:hexameric tyrosine-coordinated heme protein n=1 Tax=Paracoccus sp. S-4012 TaxID=2665648 RepID=UPI0012B05A38|nr:hexameric tyrosine-coordinated heme protein [Paracoccus sp. S-4012]MRX49506.1 peroxidase [Paracoccus sp. S-4012]